MNNYSTDFFSLEPIREAAVIQKVSSDFTDRINENSFQAALKDKYDEVERQKASHKDDRPEEESDSKSLEQTANAETTETTVEETTVEETTVEETPVAKSPAESAQETSDETAAAPTDETALAAATDDSSKQLNTTETTTDNSATQEKTAVSLPKSGATELKSQQLEAQPVPQKNKVASADDKTVEQEIPEQAEQVARVPKAESKNTAHVKGDSPGKAILPKSNDSGEASIASAEENTTVKTAQASVAAGKNIPKTNSAPVEAKSNHAVAAETAPGTEIKTSAPVATFVAAAKADARTNNASAKASDKPMQNLDQNGDVKIFSIKNLPASDKNNFSQNQNGQYLGQSGQDQKALLKTLAGKVNPSQKYHAYQNTATEQDDSPSFSKPFFNFIKNTAKIFTQSGKVMPRKKNLNPIINNKLVAVGFDLEGPNGIATKFTSLQNQSAISSQLNKIEFIQQLVSKVQEAVRVPESSGGNGMTMDFEVGNLGRMQMFLQQKGNSLRVVFDPGSDSCRQQLMDQRDELSQHLRMLGYKELALDISGNNHNGSGKGYQEEKNSGRGNDDFDNVKLAGDDQADLSQILAM